MKTFIPAIILLLLMALPVQAETTPATVLVAPGIVQPLEEERIVSSEIIGRLENVLVDENDVVKAGDIIAVINNADQKAQLAEAVARQNEAVASLKLAEQRLSRQQQLARSSNTSVAEADQARAERDIATAVVERSKAIVALATANLDKTVLRSPISGTVLRRYALTGEAVTNFPPTEIVSIGNLSTLRVRAEVDELDISRIKIGQRVIIKSDALPELKAEGQVIRVTLRMGEREVQTSRSRERTDSNVLPVLIKLTPGLELPVGLRVDAYVLADTSRPPATTSEAP